MKGLVTFYMLQVSLELLLKLHCNNQMIFRNFKLKVCFTENRNIAAFNETAGIKRAIVTGILNNWFWVFVLDSQINVHIDVDTWVLVLLKVSPNGEAIYECHVN